MGKQKYAICPICERELPLTRENFKRVKENIQLVCSAVNQLKSNWDMDTVVYICNQIVNNYGS